MEELLQEKKKLVTDEEEAALELRIFLNTPSDKKEEQKNVY